jgi:hypothetical protein
VRTIHVGIGSPLRFSTTLVAARFAWQRSRINFDIAPAWSDGFRIRFSDPYDVHPFAEAVRRLAIDRRALQQHIGDDYVRQALPLTPSIPKSSRSRNHDRQGRAIGLAQFAQ